MKHYIPILLLVFSCQTSINQDFYNQAVLSHTRMINLQHYQLNKSSREIENALDSTFVQSIDQTIENLEVIEQDLVVEAGGLQDYLDKNDMRLVDPGFSDSYTYLTSKYGNSRLTNNINTPFKLLRERGFEISDLATDHIDDPFMDGDIEGVELLYWIDTFKGLNILQSLTVLEETKAELLILERRYFLELKEIYPD